ncbi:MAG: histidine--tRNA ligase [Methanobacteriota archaeon]
MAEFQRPRGTRDFGPDEMARRRAVEERMRSAARLFGFGEVQTPTFEELGLFTARSGEGVVDEMYAFKDKGGRDISLRPELTAPVMRWYLNDMTSAPKPIKIFYFGNCFRYERPQSGRYREFFQFGVEIIGAPLLAADTEIVALADAILKAAGLSGYQIRLGQIGILRGMLEKLGVPKDSWTKALHFLDKAEYEELRRVLDECGIYGEKGDAIVSLAQMRGGVDVLDAASKLAGDLEGLAYLRLLAARLESMGVSGLQFDLGVVRGLDYYTGMVFEIDVAELGAEKQVCGGGSYALAEVFGGKPIDSTGFAIGFDRVMLALEKQGAKQEAQGPDVYVVPVGEEAIPAASMLVTKLRAAGTVADIELMGRNISKALKYADAIKAKKVAIIGAKELADGTVTYKDMKTGEQTVERIDTISNARKKSRNRLD